MPLPCARPFRRPAAPRLAVLLAVLTALGLLAQAAPYRPADDALVLERVPARAVDARARDLQALRAAWRVRPRDPAVAVQLVRRYVEEAAAEGDPRYIGYAQATLAPWWHDAAAPVAVRVQRAVLLQYDHRFDAALADLEAAVQAEPANAEAWSWLAAVRMVQADYAGARRGCTGLAAHTTPLLAAACQATIDGLSGAAAAAAQTLESALAAATEATPQERLWSLTRLAELQERRGDAAAAERAFRAALALGVPDVYMQAAYADFLLDRGRTAEVLALLDGGARSDALLLRLAIAARIAGDGRAAGWTRDLAARFDAARARGDRTHEKEEARFALALQGDARRALALARSNYALQREPSDARILLEAALATRDPAAAAPVRAWLDANRVESAALRALVARLEALR